MMITFEPIGVIHSPFHDLRDMPIQPSSKTAAPGTIELFPQFAAGLKDLEGFSHILLIYHLHKSRRSALLVTPFLDSEPRGIFSTRAPIRPNPIGVSVVPLLKVENNILSVADLDVLDGTPLLDIKPYVPEFDTPQQFRLGWLEEAKSKIKQTRSDDRFR